MPALRRLVVAASVAGAVLLAGCTGGTDRPTTDPTGAPASPVPTETASEPTDEPTAPAEPTADPTDPAAPAEPTQAPDGRTTVTPLITWAGAGTDPGTIEVAGFVPEVIETGGTCSATIPATGMTVEAPAYADATSTSCGLLVLPTAPAGQTIILSYSSDASTGTSDPVEVAP